MAFNTRLDPRGQAEAWPLLVCLSIPLRWLSGVEARGCEGIKNGYPEIVPSRMIMVDANTFGKETFMAMEIHSPAFDENGDIPTRYTCQGQDISPPLAWSGIPGETRSLVLIVDDPDAPDPEAPKMNWVHWVLYNLPPDCVSLPEAVAELPPGTGEGLNDWNNTGYGGPCPPIGRHRYFHKLYALDKVLEGLDRPTKEDLEREMAGNILARAELIGTYQKH